MPILTWNFIGTNNIAYTILVSISHVCRYWDWKYRVFINYLTTYMRIRTWRFIDTKNIAYTIRVSISHCVVMGLKIQGVHKLPDNLYAYSYSKVYRYQEHSLHDSCKYLSRVSLWDWKYRVFINYLTTYMHILTQFYRYQQHSLHDSCKYLARVSLWDWKYRVFINYPTT
jgi:hypothetical protein